MSRKLYRWVGVANSNSRITLSSRAMHRPWRSTVLLFGGLLLFFCTAPAMLAKQSGLNEEAAVAGTDSLQGGAYKDAGVIGERQPSASTTPVNQQSPTDPQKTDRSGGEAGRERRGPELQVQFRQVNTDSLKQRWVELRVEVLGTDGKTNAAYNGSVTASLILAEPGDRDDQGTLNGDGDDDPYTEKAVHLESNFAVKGIAVLRFSPPIDGTYRFNVTCGGCKKRVMTERHQLAAGEQAFLKVVSQPSGGTSGTVLKQQPAVQIMNRNGGPLNQKARIVATLISASDESLRAVDAHGNETTSPPGTHREGQAVEVGVEAFDESGHSATCLPCTRSVADSSAVVQAISTARVHVHPLPLLIERRSVGGSKDDPPPTDNWAQLRVSLRADEWKLEAPQHPVVIEVGAVTILSPKEGLMPEDGARYLKVQPTRLVFSPENATEVQEIHVQPWSPGILVGSEELSPPSSKIFIGAFSVQLRVISEDPAWSSSSVSFDLHPPSFLPSLTSIMPQDANSVVVYAKDSDTRELLLSFPNSQLVREGEKIEYTMRLTSKPLANEKVEVKISASDSCAVQPELLVFTEDNWDSEQTVLFFVEQDNIAPSQVGTNLLQYHDAASGGALNVFSSPHCCGRLTLPGFVQMRFPVTWLSDLDTVVDSPNVNLEFTLSSQPVHPVSLKLSCEGLEVTGHQSEPSHAEESPDDDSRAGENGEIFVSRCHLKASSDDPNYNSGNLVMSESM
ncbi:hypothetical protein Emed_007045 [Eimeria media]